jgi:hypothetical protein
MPRWFLVLASLAGGPFVIACSPSSSSKADPPDTGVPDACGTGGSVTADDGGVTCLGTFVSCADLTTPAVSFQNDILPILRPGCSIAGSTCHGTPSVVMQQRPYFGNFDGGTDASQVLQGIVGVKSQEDPQMDIIAPGDPSQSYLMHKIDGDQCTLVSACKNGNTTYTDCGQQMPYSSPPLDPATADVVRRWIAQGAKND